MVAWAREQGLPLDVEEIFHPATVNRYAVTHLEGVSNCTRRSRRALLTTLSRRITRRAPWEPRRETLRAPPPRRPYTPAQVAQLLWWAPRQASAVRRQGLAAAVALGVGAGLRGTEMTGVSAADVRVRGEHVIIDRSWAQGPGRSGAPAVPRRGTRGRGEAGGGHCSGIRCRGSSSWEMCWRAAKCRTRVKPVTSIRLRSTWEVAMVQAVPIPMFTGLSGLTGI